MDIDSHSPGPLLPRLSLGLKEGTLENLILPYTLLIVQWDFVCLFLSCVTRGECQANGGNPGPLLALQHLGM